jgi:hypothetical protein
VCGELPVEEEHFGYEFGVYLVGAVCVFLEFAEDVLQHLLQRLELVLEREDLVQVERDINN